MDKKLRDQFNVFQHEYKDLLIPYFKALGLDGDTAFKAYKKAYNESQPPIVLKILGASLYSVASLTMVPALSAFRERNTDPFNKNSFTKTFSREAEVFIHMAKYHTEKEILKKAQQYEINHKSLKPF